MEASIASVTGDVRLDGDPIPDAEARHLRANLDNLSRGLVSRNHGVVAQILPTKDVDISATDAACVHAHHSIVGTGLGER